MMAQSPHLSTNSNHHPSATEDANNIGLAIKTLKNRQHIIWLFLFIFATLSALYTLKTAPHYTANARIMLTATGVMAHNSNTTPLNGPDLMSQIQIMQSPDIIEQLVIEQQLYRDPEFGGAKTISDFYLLSADNQQHIIARISKNLSITPVSGTTILNVGFKSIDPLKSSMIANAFIDVYAKTENNRLQNQSQSALNMLAERLNTLKNEVFIAETALEKARIDNNNLDDTPNQNTRLERMAYLNKSLSKADVDLAHTTSILNALEKSSAEKEDAGFASGFIADRTIQNLKSMESALTQKKAALEKTYGPKHPEMIAIKAEMRIFQEKLKAEMTRHIKTYRKKKDILEGKINLMQQQINSYKNSYRQNAQQRFGIRNLKTQAETARILLDNFTKSYMEKSQNLNIANNPVRIIAAATLPKSSNMAEKILIILFSSLTGLFIGIIVAFILDQLENTVQSAHQLERLSGLPVYSLIPKIKLGKKQKIANYLTDHAASPIAESVRSLFTTLQLRDPHTKQGARVVTVTSTYADEGKTTNAIWLATVAAQSGKKVLIIDGDMRRPSIHKMYEIGNAKGLTDYLSDRLALDDVIYKNHPSGVHLMTSKAVPTRALVLLSSDRMESMIRRLKNSYDLIIIDAPTSFIFSDARIMAQLSDKTLYVVEWGKTDRDDLKESLNHFTNMHYNDLALILNKIDSKKTLRIEKKEMAYMNDSHA